MINAIFIGSQVTTSSGSDWKQLFSIQYTLVNPTTLGTVQLGQNSKRFGARLVIGWRKFLRTDDTTQDSEETVTQTACNSIKVKVAITREQSCFSLQIHESKSMWLEAYRSCSFSSHCNCLAVTAGIHTHAHTHTQTDTQSRIPRAATPRGIKMSAYTH